VVGVEAVDRAGNTFGRSAEATVIINVLDANDQGPRFLKKKYQGFMNGDLTKLRNDLQVQVILAMLCKSSGLVDESVGCCAGGQGLIDSRRDL
jgi:hypothetical protein